MEVTTSPAAWKEHLWASVRHASAGVVAGFLAGAIVGGLGGRVAMLVLRLTSDPALQGVKTDDGFIIGRVSFDTVFLVLLAAGVGVLGGLLYLAVRPWIPPRLRAPSMGAFAGVVGGSLVVRPEGLDFTVLEPLPLAVVLFVTLPALYGWTTAVAVERLLGEDSALASLPPPAIAAVTLVLLAPLAPLAPAVVTVGAGVWALNLLAPGVASHWRSPAMAWIGRAALLVGAGVALVRLVEDVADIL